MIVNFSYTILYVEDVEKTISFYRDVFQFEQKMITPEKDYGELSTGSTTLSFASLELGNSNLSNGFIQSDRKSKPFGLELAFLSDDPEGLMKKAVAHGAELLEPLTAKPWGQKVGYLRDLDGFLLEIASFMPEN